MDAIATVAHGAIFSPHLRITFSTFTPIFGKQFSKFKYEDIISSITTRELEILNLIGQEKAVRIFANN